MFSYWLVVSSIILLIGVGSIVGLFIAEHRLVLATKKDPVVHKMIGSPRSIFDISQFENNACYQAYTRFMTEKQYLTIDNLALKKRFIQHLAIVAKLKIGIKLFVFYIVFMLLVFLLNK